MPDPPLAHRLLEILSAHRLGGEPVPDDLARLVQVRQELFERTGFELSVEPDWEPWNDTSYLTAAELANPDLAANVAAMHDVHARMAFVLAHEDGEYLGYWRDRPDRPIAECPLAYLDNEGQYRLEEGRSLAEGLISAVYDDELQDELRTWFRELGISIANELAEPEVDLTPEAFHDQRYAHHRNT